MIKWKEYTTKDGEQIEFCCDTIKSVYGNLITWDPAEKKWAIKVDRTTMYQDPYTSKYIVKKVEGIQDLKSIDYCMFCGKNIYKDEMRYNTTGSGWGGKVYVCGNAVGYEGITYICGNVPISLSATINGPIYYSKDNPGVPLTLKQADDKNGWYYQGECGLCIYVEGKTPEHPRIIKSDKDWPNGAIIL